MIPNGMKGISSVKVSFEGYTSIGNVASFISIRQPIKCILQ